MSDSGASHRLGALLRDVIEAIALAAVLFFVLRFVVQNTVVDGPSMEPNLSNHQWVLVDKLAYRLGEPSRGDVIVFHAPDGTGKEFIKRIIALPGETISIRDGVVKINGEVLDEPWQPRLDESAFGPYVVPEGKVFVLGDNRSQSNDSRSWSSNSSALDEDMIVGRAWLRIWPPSAWGRIGHDTSAVHAQGASGP